MRNTANWLKPNPGIETGQIITYGDNGLWFGSINFPFIMFWQEIPSKFEERSYSQNSFNCAKCLIYVNLQVSDKSICIWNAFNFVSNDIKNQLEMGSGQKYWCLSLPEDINWYYGSW